MELDVLDERGAYWHRSQLFGLMSIRCNDA